MKKLLKRLIILILVVVLVLLGITFGPRILARIFGGANLSWVSERFSEELVEKRELIVLEKTITGQESVSTDAWLIGTVQEVIIPYSFTASFCVDLSAASVQYDEENNVIRVSLPTPAVDYYKLTVDEESVEKYDFLYPLTSDRYTQMKLEMEQKLYNEVVSDPELEKSAWASAVSQTEALYQTVLDASGVSATFAIEVLEAEPLQ